MTSISSYPPGAHDRGQIRAWGRRLGLRQRTDAVWDRLRLVVDVHTDPIYQPLDYAGIKRSGKRETGSKERWEAMLPVVIEAAPRSALDIGCNVGWFSLNLARLGIPTVGIEPHGANYRTALYSAARSKVENFSLMVASVGPDTIELLPAADCVLFLSVWHHLVHEYGLAEATALLTTVWERTGKLLFFETGEDEMPATFALPDMQPNAQTWLRRYLAEACPGGSVEHLGYTTGGIKDGEPVFRSLFVVRQAAPDAES